jgi:hypothetical protein
MYSSLLKQKNRIFTFGVYILVFLYSVYPETDRDWGWHYRYGEYFFKNWKLLNEDIYSWTLPGYHWINHSWLYDLFLYQAHQRTGFVGLSILGALVTLFAFWILCKNYTLSFWKTGIAAIFFVYLTQVGIEEGLRSQVVSLFLFSILITILIHAKENTKKLIYLVPLFIFWVNLHADFVLGLLITGLFIGIYSITKYLKKCGDIYDIFWEYAKYVALAFAVTFLNPYTYLIYTETPRHLGNDYLKNVLEWDPLFDNCGSCHPYIFLFYCAIFIFLFLIALRKRKFEMIPFAILSLLFFWSTYHTRRFEPVFLVVTFPVLLSHLETWKFKLEKFAIVPLVTSILILILLEFNLFTRFNDSHLYHFTESDYCFFASSCSIKIVDYVNEHTPVGNGFTFYDWGGYFIGKGMSPKLFIDGRMHVWRDSNGYQPFADYIDMYYNQDFGMFNRYDFDWMIIPNDSPIAQKVFTSKDLGVWKLEFQDGVTDYFVRVR